MTISGNDTSGCERSITVIVGYNISESVEESITNATISGYSTTSYCERNITVIIGL